MEDLSAENVTNAHSPPLMEQSSDGKHQSDPAEPELEEAAGISVREETSVRSPVPGVRFNALKPTDGEEVEMLEPVSSRAESHSSYSLADEQVPIFEAEHSAAEPHMVSHLEENELLASEVSIMCLEHNGPVLLEGEESSLPELAAPPLQEYREASLRSLQGRAEFDDGVVKEEADPDPAHDGGSVEDARHEIVMIRDQIKDTWDVVTKEPVASAEEDVEAAGSGDGNGVSENEFSVAIDARRRGGRRPKRGRPSSKVQGIRFPSQKKDDEEVCFICFDGGDLVVCDRRGCPKVYHPSCVNREESYFQSKGQWSCGWHICSKCQKSASYMCYTCTYSLCKVCVNDEEFTCIREKKGFCPSCMGTILLMETSENADEKAGVDFNDRSCWEYLFKDYWFDLKGKLSMNLDEITKARTASKVCSFAIANGESSDDGRGVSSDRSSACHDESISSKKKLNLARSTTCEISRKEGQIEGISPPEDTSRKRKKIHSRNATAETLIKKGEIEFSTVPQENPLTIKVKKRSRRTANMEDSTKITESEISVCKKSSSRKKLKRKSRRASEVKLLNNVDKELTTNVEDTNWASKELLAFVSHVKNGDKSILAYYDVQELLLDYIKANNLRDPRRRSQIICDKMLLTLFGKSRVGHFEMLKLVESHFLNKTSSSASDENQGGGTDPIEMGNEVNNDLIINKKRVTWKRLESKLHANLYDYAAIDTYNINLMYLRRSLMEELIDDMSTFCEKVFGSFVRIRVTASNQRQEVYRLVQVVGCGKAPEEYKTGKKTTDVMLEIINLDKKEVITIDIISNQDFTEEECKRLRQSIKFGFISRLTVGEVQEKVRVLQAVRVSDHLENEKLRLIHLRDRASEKGRKKEHRECVEKLQLLSTPEEQMKRLNEVPDVHTDPKMDPTYESPEEDVDEDENKEGILMQFNFKGRELISPQKEGIYNWSGALKSSNSVIPMGRARHSDDFQSMELHSDVAARVSELPSHKIEDEKVNVETQKIESKVPAVEPLLEQKEPLRESVVQPEPKLQTLAAKFDPRSNDGETEKLWHYKDPSGKIQGPFSMAQLRKWSKHFPSNLGIWRKSERQEDSILLTDALAGLCYAEGDNIQPRTDVISEVSALEGFSTQKHDLAFPSNSESCSNHCVPKLTVKLIDHSTSSTESNTMPEVSPCDPSITRFQNGEASDVKPIVASNAFESVSPQRSDASTFPKPTPESLQSAYANSFTKNSGTSFSTMHPVNNAYDQALSQNGEPNPLVSHTISSCNWNLPINTKDREQSVPYLNSTTMLSSSGVSAVNCQNTMLVSCDGSKPFSSPQLSNSTSTVTIQPSNMSWGTGTPEVNNSGWQVPNQYQNLATAVGNLLYGSGVQGGLGPTNNLGWGMIAQGNMPWGVPPNANNAWGQGLAFPPQGNAPSNFVWGTAQGSTIPNDGCRPTVQGNVAPYPFWNAPVQGNASQNPVFMPAPFVGNMNQNVWGIPNQGNTGAINTPGIAHENKNSAWDSPKNSSRNFISGSGYGSGMQSRNWMASSIAEGPSRPLENTGICKYFESGHCKKGASCNYTHS